jgi:hypothetical protein
MESERTGYLYRHIRKDKDEVFYIGIGFDKDKKRATSHHSRNQYWKNIVNLTDFEVEILFENISEDSLVEKEKEFISLYGRKDLKEGVLVNMTDGGDGTVRCRFKNPNGWKNIKKDKDKFAILCKNREKPFQLIIKEPEQDEYILKCSNWREFEEKTKLTRGYLITLKRLGAKMISTKKSNQKNNFPVGTIIKFEELKREKLIYPKEQKATKHRKPFNLMVYDDKENLIEEIYCGDREDFEERTSMNIKSFKNIKKYGFHKIRVRYSHTKHSFPLGTLLKINYLGKIAK